MRDFNEDIADKIRQWTEIPPYPHCGAVWLRGMFHEFCCKPFAGRIRNHLPPPMGRKLLDHIVEMTQSIPNFPRFRIVTCDPFSSMLVFHHPMQVLQTCSYPVFPILWTLTSNSSLQFLQSSFARNSGFQYPLVVQKRLSLLFSHKTEHSKVISEIN
jgi:hypothetical protein